MGSSSVQVFSILDVDLFLVIRVAMGEWLAFPEFLLWECPVLGFLLTLTHLVLSMTNSGGHSITPILKMMRLNDYRS